MSALNHLLIAGVLGVPMLMAAGSSGAAEKPYHVGVDITRSEADDVQGLRIDDSATGFRLATGYRFAPWFGVEAAFIDFGELDTDVSVGGVPMRLEAEADGFEVALIGRLPIGQRFALSAGLGNLWWSADTSVAGIRADDSDDDFFYRLGADFMVSERFSLTAGWHSYELDEVEIDTVSLGAQVRFGEAR